MTFIYGYITIGLHKGLIVQICLLPKQALRLLFCGFFMEDIKVFLPFAKKDSDQFIVEGFASTEAVDSQGEVVKSEAIQRALPDYMKFGNIREMHQFSAVGKTISADMKETEDGVKGLYLAAKVVDKGAWEKCKEGVYNGFSIGGRVVKRVGNVIQELSLNEISLVDRPANPLSVFSLVKMEDGKMKDQQLNKYEEDTTDSESESKQSQIYRAGHILSIAEDLCYLYQYYEMKGSSTKEIEKAIALLRSMAVTELQGEEKKKFDDMINDLEKKFHPQFPEVIEITNKSKHQWSDTWVNDYMKFNKKVLI